MGIALFIDSPDGVAPEYNGLWLRRALGGLLWQGVSSSIGARSGVFPVSRTDHISVSGSEYLIPPMSGVIWKGDSASGAYIVAEGQLTGNIPPRDGALPRIDSIYMRVYDDSVDDQGEYEVKTEYIEGIPGSDPTPPVIPPDAHRLCNFEVPPSSQAGQPITVQNVYQWTVANGGVLPVRDATELPTGSRLIESMMVDRWDTDTLYRWSGSAWHAVASEPAHRAGSALANWAAQHVSTTVRQTQETSFGNISGGPTVTAEIGPSGAAMISFGAQYTFPNDTNQARLAQLRVSITGATTRNVGADNAEGRNAPDGYSNSVSATIVVTGLTPGTHTFTLQYSQTSPNGCDWAARELSVLPLG